MKMSHPSRFTSYLSRYKHSALDKMLRVDHAGELGADRIYHGQSFVLGSDPQYGPCIQKMWDQEKVHLEEMEYMNLKYRTRKSALEPLWSLGGFLMGSASAMLGPKAAMACTVAVERVITQHYNDQIRQLIADGGVQESKYVLDKLSQFRDEEQEHRDSAGQHEGVEEHQKLMQVIDVICKTSIKVAGRT